MNFNWFCQTHKYSWIISSKGSYRDVEYGLAAKGPCLDHGGILTPLPSLVFFLALTLYGPITELCDATVTIKDTCFNYLLLSYNYGTQGPKRPFYFCSQFCGKEFGWFISDAHGDSYGWNIHFQWFHHSWFLYWFTLPLTSLFLSSLLIFCLCLPLFFILSPSLHLPSSFFLLPHSHSLSLRFLKL